MPTTAFTDLHDTMRALLGDRQVHGNWLYSSEVLSSALRSVFITGRQPTGYQLDGDNPFAAVALAPAIKLGDDAALIIYDACMTLISGEDGHLDFITRSLTVRDYGDRKADLLWELRGKIEEIRNGGAVWSTLQTLAQYVGALPHALEDRGVFETQIGLSPITVHAPLGDIVI